MGRRSDWLAYGMAVTCFLLQLGKTEQFQGSHAPHLQVAPRFITPIENVTAPEGRDAKLTCNVDHLTGFKVAWIYKGLTGRTVLTAASQTITKNPRISAFQEGASWVLFIRDVSKKDEGIYLCQVNTKPPASQLGFLSIVVPPVIDDATSSNDVIVDEGNDVRLKCSARGDPPPQIRWIREGERGIRGDAEFINDGVLEKTLFIEKATREDAGAYLCVATNGVPPSVSKRVILEVNFPPFIIEEPIEVTSYGVVMGTDLTLTCRFKARPRGSVRWFREQSELSQIPPFVTITVRHGQDPTTWISTLSLRLLHKKDFGSFQCMVESRLGMDKSSFRVYEVTTTSTTTVATTARETTTSGRLKTIFNRPTLNHNSLGANLSQIQPPYFPWWTETTTDSNSFTEEDSRIGKMKKIPSHKQDSFFGTSSAVDSPLRTTHDKWAKLQCYIMLYITCNLVLKFIYSTL